LLQATEFLRRELPVRLAHRVVELENLPLNLNNMPSILKVRKWYIDSFQELVEFPKIQYPTKIKLPPASSKEVFYPEYEFTPEQLPKNVKQVNDDFVSLIDRIKKRHDPVTATIAQGIMELKESLKVEALPGDIQQFLDRFHMSRIGIRFLIGQHIALNKNEDPNFVGIINTKTNIAETTQEAIENARYICKEYYDLDDAPKVVIFGKNIQTFPYVESHLHHMLFELLKNSLRAVVEFHGKDAKAFPNIKIVFAQGDEDLAIKISDEGGGIPRSGMARVWGLMKLIHFFLVIHTHAHLSPYFSHFSYSYTTAKSAPLSPDFNQGDFKAPMAGFGYGLPLSRLYARYFGGDLVLISMEGYGTDAYIHLSRLGDGEEPLP